MSAEGKPQTRTSCLAVPCVLLARLAARFPVCVIVVSIAAAAVSMWLAATRLEYRTSRTDLLNPKSSYSQVWLEYVKEFGEQDDAVVVVEGASRERVVRVLEELGKTLSQEEQLFSAVFYRVDLSRIRSKGLHYLPVADLQKIEGFLAKVDPIVHGDWAQLNLGRMAGQMLAQLAQGGRAANQTVLPHPGNNPLSTNVRSGSVASNFPEKTSNQGLVEPRGERSRDSDGTASQAEMNRLLDSLLTSLVQPERYRSPWPDPPASMAAVAQMNSEYLLANGGRLGFVLLHLATNNASFDRNTKATCALRERIAQARARHPEVKIGLTGLPILECDEMQSSQRDMLYSTLLSLVGVALLFVAGFGGIRHPLLAVTASLLAIAWSFSYITLAVGHLNILSSAFGVVLIGQGMDYTIHYVARYLQVREAIGSSREALIDTSRAVGPGIVIGAVTEAMVFYAAGLTNFKGVAELGIIAGGGLLLCCLAALTVLPAMLQVSDAHRRGNFLPAPLDVCRWLEPLYVNPRALLFVTSVGTALLVAGVGYVRYDPNLLNLQATGLESVELEKRLLSQGDWSGWFALSVAPSPGELLARKERFLKLKSVQRVEEIASLFPAGEQQKCPIIARIQSRLADLPERPPQIPLDSPADLGRALAESQALMGADPQAAQLGQQLEQIANVLTRMLPADCYQRLSEYQHRIAVDLLGRLHALRAAANPEPPQLSDLPQGLVRRFVGRNGQHAMKIYGTGNIWDAAVLDRFVRDVRSVDPWATGNPIQAHEGSKDIMLSYEKSACYALGGILIVLLLDFHSFRYLLLTIVPLALGMVQMFGIMGLLDIPLNPANMVTVPLILGLGVTGGVLVVADFRCQTGRYQISPSTAIAVLISALTSVAGFGSLMIATHHGLLTLGRALTIGMTCCLFTSLVMLPALLVWYTQNRGEKQPPSKPSAGNVSPARKIVRRDGQLLRPVAMPHLGSMAGQAGMGVERDP